LNAALAAAAPPETAPSAAVLAAAIPPETAPSDTPSQEPAPLPASCNHTALATVGHGSRPRLRDPPPRGKTPRPRLLANVQPSPSRPRQPHLIAVPAPTPKGRSGDTLAGNIGTGRHGQKWRRGVAGKYPGRPLLSRGTGYAVGIKSNVANRGRPGYFPDRTPPQISLVPAHTGPCREDQSGRIPRPLPALYFVKGMYYLLSMELP
jgi:hypothetical protein